MSASKKKKTNKNKQKSKNNNINKNTKVIPKEQKNNISQKTLEKNIEPKEMSIEQSKEVEKKEEILNEKQNENLKKEENVSIENKPLEKVETESVVKQTENQNNNPKEDQDSKQEEKQEGKEIVKKENNKPEYVQEMIKKRKNRMHVFILIVILIILLIMLSTMFAIFNLNNANIIQGVSIKGFNVSKMSREEAVYLIGEATNKELIAEIDLKFGDDYKVTLKPEQIEFEYDVEESVENAYNVGRDGHIVENNYKILLTEILGREVGIAYTYNGDLLNKFVDDINSKLPGVVVEPSYYIEDNKLFITKGTDGIQVKKEELKNQIIQCIFDRNALEMTDGYKQEINIPVENVKATEIDMNKIYSEVHSEPKDAYYTSNPYGIFADVDGIDLAISVEDAIKTVESENKDEYVFDLKITKAAKTINDLGTEAFPYLISSFSTKYDASNRNRSTNLEIAARKINGKVLMPGEEFSFNKVVGKRTVEEGYKDAKIYADGGVVDGLAGGICQISSTLYNAVLLANLEIVERRNHNFTSTYVPAGRDATVSWGGPDFKFKNNRDYPIKIVCSGTNGTIKVDIYGLKKENDYTVEIQSYITRYIGYRTIEEKDPTLAKGQTKVIESGSNGCQSVCYRILKQNGTVVSKTLLSKDTYNPHNKIVAVGTKEVAKPAAPTTPTPTAARFTHSAT